MHRTPPTPNIHAQNKKLSVVLRLRYSALDWALPMMVEGKVEARHDWKGLGTAAVRIGLRVNRKGGKGLAHSREVLVLVEEKGKWLYYFSNSYLEFLGLDSIFEEVSDLYFTGWKYYPLNHFISEPRETRLVLLSHPALQMGPSPLQKAGSLPTHMTHILVTYIFMTTPGIAGTGTFSRKLDLHLNMDISPGLPSVP